MVISKSGAQSDQRPRLREMPVGRSRLNATDFFPSRPLPQPSATDGTRSIHWPPSASFTSKWSLQGQAGGCRCPGALVCPACGRREVAPGGGYPPNDRASAPPARCRAHHALASAWSRRASLGRALALHVALRSTTVEAMSCTRCGQPRLGVDAVHPPSPQKPARSCYRRLRLFGARVV